MILNTLYLIENIGTDNNQYKNVNGAILIFLSGIAEITTLKNMILSDRTFSNKENYDVLTLHAGLSMDEQTLAFNIPKGNKRKIVLSTNIAETGKSFLFTTIVILLPKFS